MLVNGRFLLVADWINIGLKLLLYLLVLVDAMLLLDVVEVRQQLVEVYIPGEITRRVSGAGVSGLAKGNGKEK